MLLRMLLFVGCIGGKDRKSTRLNSSHANISYAVFCLKKTKTLFLVQPANLLFSFQHSFQFLALLPLSSLPLLHFALLTLAWMHLSSSLPTPSSYLSLL